jgi:uncharacterized protein YlxW (UPF0749 family)
MRSALTRPVLALGLPTALLGFGLVTLAFSRGPVRRADASHRAQLISLINARKRSVSDLENTITDLRARLDQAQRAAGQRTAGERTDAAQLAELGLLAGTTPLRGSGVVVRLADSTRVPADRAHSSAYRIQDADLQLVVNALFDSGAEAIAINDNRVATTTAIRAAGQTIVVNFRPLTPPYVVKAIGADKRQFNATVIARQFHKWVSLFGLGFSVHGSGTIEVPGFDGRVTITTATPVAP